MLARFAQIMYCTSSTTMTLQGLILCLLFTVAQGDLCLESNIDAMTLTQFIHESATPKGGSSAGLYLKDEKSSTLIECLQSCCASPLCNVAFFHQDLCFLITCNTTLVDACDPKERTGEKFQDTYMIEVRTVEETLPYLAASGDGTTNKKGGEEGDEVDSPNDVDIKLKNECTPQTADADCRKNEYCKLLLEEEAIGYVCSCISGYVRGGKKQKCVVDETRLPDTDKRSKDRTCMVGLLFECEKNEDCIPRNSRSRSGSCNCMDGYERDDDTGWCEPVKAESGSTEENEEKTTKTETSSTMSAQPTSQPPKVSPTSSKAETMSTSTPEVPTTKTSHLPTKTAPSTTPVVEPLVVSIGDNKVIQLPEDSLTLSAFAISQDKDEYSYQWSLLSQPENPGGEQIGEMVGMNTASLELSKLIAGAYTFKVAVSAEGKYGEAIVNVTVLPPIRENQAPLAVIKPTNQHVSQPNSVVLDGAESTDDDKIVHYHWEQVSGPVNKQGIPDSEAEKSSLVLHDLIPGSYRIKLTVTDSDGVENSTFANVTVIKETDYPPKANAGSNVIISLPQNSVTLYGNASTDDNKIISYEWIKSNDDKLTADVTGVRTPFLHLEHLEVGDYTFTLKVTDATKQTSTADVHVFVKPEHNKPPVANAGNNRVFQGPQDIVALDATNSTDDNKIVTYKWKQISGPTKVAVENSDRALATASKLVVGQYKFKVSVTDEESLESSSNTLITIKENDNHPPKANAGGDQEVELPAPLVKLNGSKSQDDRGIVAYSWTRNDKSLAAGVIVNNTDHQAVLQLTNLVSGRYIFTLEVADAEGLKSTDTATLFVKPESNREDLVQLEMEADISSFTRADQANLENQISLLLHRSSPGNGDPEVVIQHLEKDRSTGHLLVTFYVLVVEKEHKDVREGKEVVSVLRKRFQHDQEIVDFKVVQVDTLVCQNNCSGHGRCDQNTKKCICEAFWMENIFTANLGDARSNCDWSILYVIITAFIIVVSLAGIIWGFVCLCKRWYRSRPKKRHRYTLLEELDSDKDKTIEMLPKGKMQNSSLMISESDFTSDEETLFVNTKKLNGHANKGSNGFVKSGKHKVKT